jgi:uncharacterized protein with PQ loop repeat
MPIIEIIGFSAALLGAIHIVPQFIKSITTKNVKDISLFMIILYFIATGLWAIYGYMVNSLPVLFGDGFNFLVTLAQLVVKLKYKKNG